jgi:hypothetical protein
LPAGAGFCETEEPEAVEEVEEVALLHEAADAARAATISEAIKSLGRTRRTIPPTRPSKGSLVGVAVRTCRPCRSLLRYDGPATIGRSRWGCALAIRFPPTSCGSGQVAMFRNCTTPGGVTRRPRSRGGMQLRLDIHFQLDEPDNDPARCLGERSFRSRVRGKSGAGKRPRNGARRRAGVHALLVRPRPPVGSVLLQLDLCAGMATADPAVRGDGPGRRKWCARVVARHHHEVGREPSGHLQPLASLHLGRRLFARAGHRSGHQQPGWTLVRALAFRTGDHDQTLVLRGRGSPDGDCPDGDCQCTLNAAKTSCSSIGDVRTVSLRVQVPASGMSEFESM